MDRRDEDNMQKLYEASLRGSVSRLNTLMQNDPLIFHRISLTSYTQTPLHISSLLGHLEFTKLFLTKKPELVMELDSHKSSPLLLACVEGHREIVRELLNVSTDACLVEDQDGRIPLHLAVMRGRIEVVKLLVRAKHRSVFVQLHGDTVLHLCVKFNHLEALKVLMESVDNEEFMNLKNHQRHTILDLSAILKQFQTTNYPLSVPQIKVDPKSLIENCFPFHGSSRPDGQPILHSLPAASSGSASTTNIPTITPSQTPRQPNVATTPPAQNPEAQEVLLVQRISPYLKELLKFRSDHFEKTRGNLMVVATLIATMTLQVAVNPPGGFWQADTNPDQGFPVKNSVCKAGTAVQAYKYNSHETDINYHFFITCSTIAFSASLSIILLLISGIPLKNKLYVGILILGMSISILFTAATYRISIGFVSAPDDREFFHKQLGEFQFGP